MTRIRIAAQLVDGFTGADLWAERFDRSAEDIFTVLDEVTEIIVARLATAYGGGWAKLGEGERKGAVLRISKPTIIFSGVWTLSISSPKGAPLPRESVSKKPLNSIPTMGNLMRKSPGRTCATSG